MRFFDCATAPSPRRVRIFIAEKGLDIPTVEVDLRGGEHLGEAFRAINPWCTVPVLELDDGSRVTSSQGVWRYLEAAFPEPPLMGRTPAEQGRVADLEWHIEQDGFLAVGEALRNTARGMRDRALTGPVNHAQIAELGERGRRRAEHFLAGLDDLVGETRFIAGDFYSVADITALVSVDFAGWLKLALPEGATRARRWYEEVSARPSAAL